MQLFTSVSEVPRGFGPSAVTIGKFDGVHLGHRAVIAELKSVAEELGLAATAVTFDRHPLSLLRPELCPESLISNKQKVELLATTGVDATLMLPFDLELSQQPPEEFVRSVLVDALQARALLVGDDFRFGARGAGDVELLRRLGGELGFEVRPIPQVSAGDGRVSSTRIREHLAEGRVKAAAELLGALPTLRGVVVHGEHRGRELGYPTANLAPAVEGLIPADGVYAAWVLLDGQRYPAAVSIGNNPTFTGVPERQVEAHLFDQDLDLYGRQLTLSFVDRVRPMGKFDSVEALVTQIQQDDRDIRAILNAAAPGQS